MEEVNTVDVDDLEILRGLLASSTIDESFYDEMNEQINSCKDYNEYTGMLHRLEELQPSIDEIPAPRQKDILKHIRKL